MLAKLILYSLLTQFNLHPLLAEIEVNISEIDLYGYDIVETFLSIVRRLQAVLNDLKTKLQIHSFYKIYRIETQCPDGSNDVIRNYIK